MSTLPTALPAEQSSLLEVGSILSSDNVQLLSQPLSSESPPCHGSLPPVPMHSAAASRFLSGKREEFKAQQSSVCGMVDASLKKYAWLTIVGWFFPFSLTILIISSWRHGLLLICSPVTHRNLNMSFVVGAAHRP